MTSLYRGEGIRCLVETVADRLRGEEAQREACIDEAKRLIAVGRSVDGRAFVVASDPCWMQWQAEGAPTSEYVPFQSDPGRLTDEEKEYAGEITNDDSISTTGTNADHDTG